MATAADEVPAADGGEQQGDAATLDRPLLVLNVAGVERVLSDMDFLFESAERPELSDVVAGLLGRIGDLEGLDRSRPLGVMLFLKSSLPPRPVPVGFVPVKDIGALLKTIERGPVTTKKLEGADERYQITGPRRTLHVRVAHGYAFVAQSDDVLNRELPDPAEANKGLTTRYDMAVKISLETIPEGMKNLLLGLLRVRSGAELQQRDDEPDARYRLRKLNGERTMHFLEQLLTQGRDVTIGWDVSGGQRKAVLDVQVRATADSSFAESLHAMAGRPGRFRGLFDEQSPLSISMSWLLNERERKSLAEAFAVGEQGVRQKMAELNGGGANGDGAEGEAAPAGANGGDSVGRIFGALRRTARAGHLDLFAQFVPQENGKFVLTGGMHLVDGALFSRGLTELTERFKDHPALHSLQRNVDSHRGVVFHRLEGKQIRRQDENVYGEHPGLYLGAGENTMWFAVGDSGALSELKRAMDRVAEQPPVVAGQAEAPFRLVARINRWIQLDPPGPDARPGQKLALQAFSRGGDALQVDVRPTDDGARLRVTFGEAFLRLIGMGAGQQFDRRMEREGL